MSKISLAGFSLLLFLCALGIKAQSTQVLPVGDHGQSREAYDSPSGARRGHQLQEPLMLLPPGNDNCASAIALTPGAACITGTSNGASLQGGEYVCISGGGGVSEETVWYRFTATNTSMVLGVVLTNSTNCATVLAVYGPFAPAGGCLPGAGNQILCQNMGLIDPGFHPLLTGLVIGQSYLVQVQGNNCGGGNDRFVNFCISINTVSANNSAGSAAVINNCGVAFTGGTTGGHYANGTSIGANNLDNNVATSITGASEVGDDVTFVINNVSWFTFCNGNLSSCNWSILLNSVTNCLLPAPNAGVQSAVFTGTPAALVNVAISPSNIPPGGSFASGTFAVGAGQCAYVMVDGFAGDECNYNLTLTNVSCACIVLPIELAYFAGRNLADQVHLDWGMASQEGLQAFDIARSADGHHFEQLMQGIAAVVQADHRYVVADKDPLPGWNYYRLSVVDHDGNTMVLNTVAVYRQQGAGLDVLISAQQDQMQLDITGSDEGTATLSVTNLQGQQVLQQATTLESGSSRLHVEIPGLAQGMYVLSLTQGSHSVSKKFVRN